MPFLSPFRFTPVIIVVGMTAGVFSPTEAATVAVLYALFLSFLVYRELRMRDLFRVFMEVAASTSKLMFIITMALLFGWVLTVGRMPQQLATYIGYTCTSPWQFFLIVNVVLLILGAIIENAILTMILAPMLVPIAVQSYISTYYI